MLFLLFLFSLFRGRRICYSVEMLFYISIHFYYDNDPLLCEWQFLMVMWTWLGDICDLFFLLTWLPLLTTRNIPGKVFPLYKWSWNHYEATLAGLPMSSNIAEGWHNGIRSLLNCSHPTTWKFLVVILKLEQSIADSQWYNHLLQIPPPSRHMKCVNLDE